MFGGKHQMVSHARKTCHSGLLGSRPCLKPGSEQQALIQKIRRGYNQETVHGRTVEDDQAIQRLVEMNSRQAQVLSTELYSKPTHFLLELIQNADDCSYAPGVQPRVLLVLMHDALLHATNETGFTAADISSICSMAMSSKSRKVGAFTGEKGIGFKATAVASEVTYISSSGYTFAFDMRPGAYDVPCLGLFCPRWEEGLQERMLNWLADRSRGTGLGTEVLKGFTTRIWMQLRPDLDRQRLTQELKLLDPYMLLNLRKLKNVTVMMVPETSSNSDAPAGNFQLKQLLRVDVDGARVTIAVEEGPAGDAVNTNTHHLLCLRQVLKVPAKISESEDKRSGVSDVEVVFALPTTAEGDARPDPYAQVFAFLPVKAYGFRFHIQADFILPSSREGILEDRQWNRWLQQELAPAFIQQVMQAVTAHHQHSQSKGNMSEALEAAGGCAEATLSPAALLQYLPLPGDVLDDFMSEVSTAILQGLQQQVCVLTTSGQLSTAQHTVLPDSLLDVDGQQLISNEWLQAGLPDLEYVHADLLAGSGETVQRTSQVLLQLGSSKFTAALLLSWLNAEGTASVLESLGPEQRADWLQQLYSCCMKLRAQPDTAPMHIAADSSSRQHLRSAPILQLHGSRELVSLQQLADSSKQLYLWDDRVGGEAELQMFSRHPSANSEAASGSDRAVSGSSSDCGSHSSRQLDSLCFVDPSTLGADGAAMLSTFLGVSTVPLSVLVEHVLQQQAEGGLSDTQQDKLLLFLLRNAPDMSTHDLKLLQESLLLRSAGTAVGNTASYTLANQLYLPLEFSSLPVTQATLSDDALKQDLAAAGVTFVSRHYEGLLQHSEQAGRQGVWQLLRSFGLQQLTLQSAVQHLLKLYYSDNGGDSEGSLAGYRISLADHNRHLGFLAQCADDAVCMQHIQRGLLLFEQKQDTSADQPLGLPDKLFWPMAATAGSEALTAQLRHLCGVRLVHPWYVKQCDPAVQDLVQGITQTLSLAEVWRRLQGMHSKQCLQQCATTLGVSVVDLLLQQVEYLAGVRLELQSILQQQHNSSSAGNTSSSGSSSSAPRFLLLSSTPSLMASNQLYVPPGDTATLQLLRELSGTGHGLGLVHSCFEPCWRETDSKQYLLLTKLLGVKQADGAAVIGALVKLHSSCSAVLTESQRSRHLAYLAQHTQLLQEQKGLLKQVQESLLLQDAGGKFHKAGVLHMPLGPHFADLQSDMAAAGMLFVNSSYTADPKSQSSTVSQQAVQHRQDLRQLEELLGLLGVRPSDVNSIVKHILKLYSETADRPNAKQHMAHLRFIQERWYDLESSVQRQVSAGLLLIAAAPTADTCAAADTSSNSNNSNNSSSSSSSGVYGYVKAFRLYTLPAADSPEAQLVKALHLGGARFLHPMYYQRDSDLISWVRTRFGVSSLDRNAAARYLLEAHDRGNVQFDKFSPRQLAEHALYLAQHAESEVLANVKQQLLLAVQPRPQDTQPLYRTARDGPRLFFPAQGERWTLQKVLPVGRVMYLHPAYSHLLEALKQDSNRWYDRTRLQEFLTYHVGVNMRPVAGSGPLRRAIEAGQCWQALLLLLHDEWQKYSSDDHEVLVEQLKGLSVTTSSGSTPLPRCFMLKSNVPSSLVSLLQELHLPILQLPDPDSSGWSFLHDVGVSMELQGSTLLKVLQQLSSNGACQSLDSMQQLYSRIHALGQLDEKTSAAVKSAFEQQQLVYVPGHGRSSTGSWWRSGQVCWKPQVGLRRLYPHMVFLAAHYGSREGSRAQEQQQQLPQQQQQHRAHESLQSFFVQTLCVRNADLNDLKDSLLHFADKDAKNVAENVQSIYEHLAEHIEDRDHPRLKQWLKPVLNQNRVLLVKKGQALSFAKASSGPIYLPDSIELQKLFADDASMLAVHAEKLPALQPLLTCIQPPLPSLSSSVQRSFAEADDGVQKQRARAWEQLLQQALPFLARYLYCFHLLLFKALLDGRHLLQLSNMHVFAVRGLVQKLTLGDVSKQIPTEVAAQMLSGEQLQQWLQQSSSSTAHKEGSNGDGDCSSSSSSSSLHPVLLVDAAATQQPRILLHHVAVTYVDLLLQLAGSSSSSRGVEQNTSSSSSRGVEQNTSSSSTRGAEQSSSSRQLPVAADLFDIVQRLRSFLRELKMPGGAENVAADLQCDGIPCLPPEFDPWLVATQGDSSDSEDDDEVDEPLISSGRRTAAAEGGTHTEATGQRASAGAAHEQACAAVQQAAETREQVRGSGAAAAAGGEAAGNGSDSSPARQDKRNKPIPAAPVYTFPVAEDPAASSEAAPAASRRRSKSRERIERDFDAMVAKAAAQVESLRLADAWLTQDQADTDASQRQPGDSGLQQAAAGASSPNKTADEAQADTAGWYSLDEVVPEGGERDWMARAVTAAQAAADNGIDLQQLWQQQPQLPRTSSSARLPGSYIVQMPAETPAGGCGTGAADEAVSIRAGGNGSGSEGRVGSAAPAAPPAAAAAYGQAPAAQPGSSAAAEPEQRREVGAAAAGEAAAGSPRSIPSGSSGGLQPGAAADPYGGPLKVVGDVGERYVYELFAKQLPGFTSSCWHSGTRALIGLPAPSTEPSYDFMYTDVEGQLSGQPGTRCFIECKATTARLSDSSPKPFEISSRQWELARSLHDNPDQGKFMIVRVDRVGSGEGPRIAAVLQDPVQLWKDGQLRVTTPDRLFIEGYPVAAC